MEVILKQRFQFARVDLYKNYCDLNERRVEAIMESPDVETVPMVRNILFNEDYISVSNSLTSLIKNKKALYFDKLYDLQLADTLYVNSDDEIKKYYGNPFASVHIYTFERTIVRKGDLLVIKAYTYHKNRLVQTRYYKKKKTLHCLSINLNNGNFRVITHQNKLSTFRTNYFMSLNSMIFNLFDFGDFMCRFNSNIADTSVLNDKEFNLALFKYLKFDIKVIKNYDKNGLAFLNQFIKFFVDKKKIKVPNEYADLIKYYYPTEKYLKKNDRKLVQSILDFFGIKSKYINKLVHINLEIDIFNLVVLCHIFGDDYAKYISSIRLNCLKVFGGRKLDPSSKTLMLERLEDIKKINPKNIDKEKIVKIINSTEQLYYPANSRSSITMTDVPLVMSIDMIVDHINMLNKIREYDENKMILANNYQEFHTEHNEFSDIVSKIKKGWTVEYQFNQDMVSDIETPIDVKINIGNEEFPSNVFLTFYPKILKREEEYIEEGRFMHHCVASYADKESSIIISLRTLDEKDRITCEFDSQRGNNLQARHFCNKEVPGDFDLALDVLKEKTIYYARRGMLHYTHKKRVPVKINDKEVEPPKIEATLNEHLFPPNF